MKTLEQMESEAEAAFNRLLLDVTKVLFAGIGMLVFVAAIAQSVIGTGVQL